MINSNIPIPIRHKRFAFPWDSFQVGDSIDIPVTRRPSLQDQFKTKSWGFVSTTKGTPEFPLEKGFARVWRDVDIPVSAPVSAPVAEEVISHE